MKNIALLLSLIVLSINGFSQTISRIEPENWWIGMKLNTITILVYGEKISDLSPTINYKEVQIIKTVKVENPNYLFVTLKINDAAKAGVLKIDFQKAKRTIITKDFPLLEREKGSSSRSSYTTKDAIFLLVPDRFSNGNTQNDIISDYYEKTVDRNDENKRHGGDIEGILNYLDYIKSLGFTQIWCTPLIENNQPNYSYHGYAATDFYKIDARFGNNEQFKKLVFEARKREMGVIWDVVLNHCGSEYYFIKDLPSKDWINNTTTKTRSNHLKTTITDPYASEVDKSEYADGWFDNHMPDLNQKNELMANYLIQNTIWWIEYASISGLREDTFSYSDKEFLTKWTSAILNEYPNFNIVGEEMTTRIDLTSYWQKDKINNDGYKCYLPTLMDFSLNDNLVKALNGNKVWFSPWRDVYQSIAQDYQFPNPYNQLIFPDNHDLDRFYSRLNKNFDNWRLGIALYMTMRGIPQFYYGTEVLMCNEKPGSDGQRRSDFYGGWKDDTKNAVSGTGLTSQEKEAQRYFSKLLNWRKHKNVIHTGKLLHYNPTFDDVYVYFRYNDTEKVMVILNKNESQVTLNVDAYKEIIPNQFKADEIISGQEIIVNKKIEVPGKTAMILEIK